MGEFKPVEAQETFGRRPSLREVLTETRFRAGRGIDSDLPVLRLDEFHEEASRLANACFCDGHNQNYFETVYLNKAGDVISSSTLSPTARITPNNMSVYETIPLPQASDLNFGDGESGKAYLGMIIHTSSNTNRPFSAGGLAALLREDDFANAPAAIFVAGINQNMVVFRTARTPQLSKAESEEKMRSWVFQLDTILKDRIRINMSREEIDTIINDLQMKLFRKICEVYSLAYFSGPMGNLLVTRQDRF